jgi:hypothetical protein
MRPFLTIWAIGVLTLSCTGSSPYSVTRPPVHPLLEPTQIDPLKSARQPRGPDPIEGQGRQNPSGQRPTTLIRPKPASQTKRPKKPSKRHTGKKKAKVKPVKVALFPLPTGDRAKVLARLYPLVGRPLIGQERPSDLGLVNAAYADFNLSAASVGELYGRGAPVGRYPTPADIVFFNGEGGSPQLGVVTGVYRDWVMDVATVTRGRVRIIRLFPGARHLRTARGRVYNSFLRRKRKTDRRGAPYLAGQLVVGYRSYFAAP